MRLFSFLLIISISLTLMADPVVVKGVDGTWLPVIASSWSESNSGVTMVFKESIDLVKLRIKLSGMFPNLKIEIKEKALFFNAANTDSLLTLLSGADTGMTLPEPVIKSGAKLMNTDVSGKQTLPEEIESTVESVSFDPKSGSLFINVNALKHLEKGTVTEKMTLHINYKMKDGAADPEDENNNFFGKLILLKKGNKLFFTPVRIKGNKYPSISNYTVRK